MTDLAAPALAGRTVLVPRALDRAVGLAARLHEAGARVLVSAVIERAPADDTAALDDAARALAAGEFAWTLVTSVNAVDELVAAWRRVRTGPDGGLADAPQADAPQGLADAPHADAPQGLADAPTRWAAVGPATAKALRGVGVEPGLVPAESSALGLLAALRSVAADPTTADLRDPRGGATDPRPGADDDPAGERTAAPGPRVLLPLGDLAAPTLERGLAAMGARPHVVTAYRTVTHPVDPAVAGAWRAGDVDAVVLTSGSVAREVAAQLGARDDVATVAIGEPTRRAATAAGLRVAAVAATPDDAGLAAAVVAALTTTDPARDPAPTAASTTDPTPAPTSEEDS